MVLTSNLLAYFFHKHLYPWATVNLEYSLKVVDEKLFVRVLM